MSLARFDSEPTVVIVKPLFAAMLVLCAVLPPALAQVRVEIDFDQQQYLANEPLLASVKITNFSGRPLKLGKDPAWLKFEVQSVDGFIVQKFGDPPVVEEFEVPSSKRGVRRVDLAPYFDMAKPGRYQVTAIVNLPGTEQELVSNAGAVNIMGGTKLWEQDFGSSVPGADPNASETRKYALIQASHGKGVRLYARVSDSTEDRIYRIFALGPLLSFSRPEAQVDNTGMLHVLFQTGAHAFTYTVVRPDGELSLRHTYEYAGSRPKLRSETDGAIRVVGSSRLLSPSDFPKAPAPSDPQPGTNSVPDSARKPDESVKN